MRARDPIDAGAKAAYRARCEAVEQSFGASARREGRDYRIHCPFCVSSKTGRADYSMGVVAATGQFYCHRCETGGKLREAPNPELALLREQEPEVTEIEPPEGFIPLGYEPGLSAESLAEVRAYAARRQIGPERARELKVGAVLEGYYAGRLVVPLLDPEDPARWLGWVGRDWTGLAERKYLYPVGMPRGKHLYNEQALDDETDEPVLVVEGVLDVMPFYPDAVAVLGKPSHAHVERLARAKRPLCVVLDGDAARDGHALAMKLQFDGARAGSVRLPGKADPDEVDPDALRAAARRSIGQFEMEDL